MKCQCPPRLKHRVTIERPTYTQDATNEQIATWSTYSTQFADCRAISARDVVQAEQVYGSGTWVIELNKSTTTMGITSGMRARWTDGREIVADFDGPAMPSTKWPRRVVVRAVEQTA
jgi:head-tail adaptor